MWWMRPKPAEGFCPSVRFGSPKWPFWSGDYLLSRGLLISMENDGVDLLRITSKAVEAMSEGELLQIEKARRLDITEEVYYRNHPAQNRFVDRGMLRCRGRQCRRRPRPRRIDAVLRRGNGHRLSKSKMTCSTLPLGHYRQAHRRRREGAQNDPSSDSYTAVPRQLEAPVIGAGNQTEQRRPEEAQRIMDLILEGPGWPIPRPK